MPEALVEPTETESKATLEHFGAILEETVAARIR